MHLSDLDVDTLYKLATKSKRTIQLLLPLNTKRSLSADLQQSYDVHEMDWWDSKRMVVPEVGSVQITCTPAQHFSGRGLFDRNASLWASWAIEGLQKDTGGTSMKVGRTLARDILLDIHMTRLPGMVWRRYWILRR